jgi:hypothetical protein
MQIKSAGTGVTEVKDLQIQKSIGHLIIVKTGAAAIIGEKITLRLNTQGGSSKTVIPLTTVRRCAVISQFGEGYQLIQDEGSSVIRSEFRIALSDMGAVELQNGDYLTLDLTELVSGSTYSVFGLESPTTSRQYFEYGSQVLSASEAQIKNYVPEADVVGLGLSNNGSLSSVRISYNNGNEVTYSPTELRAIMRNMNDVSFASDTLIEGDAISQSILGGGVELFWLPLSDVARFEVVTVGGTDLTIVQLIRRGY